MATGYTSSMKNSNRHNGDNTKCTICQQNFVDPRQLPCSHIFCFRCICAKVSTRYGTFTCPVDEEEHKQNETTERSETDIESQNKIFIGGLPVTMHMQQLYQTLSNVFGTVGLIEFNPKINKLSIYIITDKFIKNKLKGTATVTFEDKDSVEKAIEKYNGRQVPALNDAKVFVSKWKQNKTFASTDEPSIPKSNTNDTYSITIDGIPTNMSKYQLYQTLSNIFTEIGRIKFNPITNKPSIYLFTDTVDKRVLIGRAKITFADEQSVVKAIQTYDGECVPLLNNSRIYIKKSDVVSKSTVIPEGQSGPKKPLVVSESSDIDVWTLCEGFVASKFRMKSIVDIDDLKKAVFAGSNNSNSYQAYYQNRQLSPGETVPNDTTSDRPVVLRKISPPGPLVPPLVTNPDVSNSINDPYIPKNFHIVVDNSNIMIASKTIYESKAFNQNIRVNVKNLVRVVEKSDKLEIEIRTRIVGGSVPANGNNNARFQNEWKLCLYKCMFVERTGKEPFVDNALHAECLNIIFHNDNYGRVQQVLVLLTGDGNLNEGQTNFPKVVETALTRNWHVELWSWRLALNQYYLDLQKRFSNQLIIKYLDEYRNEITFLQKSNHD